MLYPVTARYAGADECKTSIETVSKAFAEAVEYAVNERMKGNPPKIGASGKGKAEPASLAEALRMKQAGK